MSGWQHVQKIHVPNWFPTVSDWFRLVSRHLFWGLCFKHRESWVIFGGICEGPSVLDVLTCSHFESTGLADPDKQTSESLGFELPAHQSCHIQTKLPNLWREPWVVRFQQDDLALNLPSPPLSCRSLTLGHCAGQTGPTRQLSSDPGLGTVSFRGGQVCKGLTVSRLDQHVPLTALDPLYPLFLFVVDMFFICV